MVAAFLLNDVEKKVRWECSLPSLFMLAHMEMRPTWTRVKSLRQVREEIKNWRDSSVAALLLNDVEEKVRWERTLPGPFMLARMGMHHTKGKSLFSRVHYQRFFSSLARLFEFPLPPKQCRKGQLS